MDIKLNGQVVSFLHEPEGFQLGTTLVGGIKGWLGGKQQVDPPKVTKKIVIEPGDYEVEAGYYRFLGLGKLFGRGEKSFNVMSPQSARFTAQPNQTYRLTVTWNFFQKKHRNATQHCYITLHVGTAEAVM